MDSVAAEDLISLCACYLNELLIVQAPHRYLLAYAARLDLTAPDAKAHIAMSTSMRADVHTAAGRALTATFAATGAILERALPKPVWPVC